MTDTPESPTFLEAHAQGQQSVALPTAPLFSLGKVVSTPGALAAMRAASISPLSLLRRHLTGDWGDLDSHDKQLNDQAIKDGSRIFSAYDIGDGERIWLTTEADRSVTTFLLPSEY